MADLLSAVKGNNATYQGDYDDPDIDDIEDQVAPPPTDAEREMQEFFRKVEQIKIDLAAIKELQKDVLSMHEKGKTIVKSKEMQKHRDLMQVSRVHHLVPGFAGFGLPLRYVCYSALRL